MIKKLLDSIKHLKYPIDDYSLSDINDIKITFDESISNLRNLD